MGLVEVAGYYSALSRAMKPLGVETMLLTVEAHPFAYCEESAPAIVRLKRRMLQWSLSQQGGGARRQLLRLSNRAVDLMLLAWAAARFDMFVFGFGSSFTGRPGIEYPLLRRLGKRVVCVFHGSDARPPYIDGAVMAPARGATPADCVRFAQRVKAHVSAVDRHADVVVENPLSSHFHERRCVNWFAVGVPVTPPATPHASRPRTDGVVRILHSPSHPEAKGSARIRAAVDALKARGLPLELVEITGRPNQEVLREIARCDFVVDQLFSDTPMATFAAEAAWFGKAAVVGGYGADEFARSIPRQFMPPSEYCRPEEVERAIERLATDAGYRAALGARAEAFVRRRWAPGRVARRFLRVLEGRIPEGWHFDPSAVRYTHGIGFPEARARELIREVIRIGGAAALCVADKPELERRLLDFAGKPSEV
jgi:hypothetical protein